MTTDLDDQLNAIVSIPVHLLQYIDQECIIDNADDEAREAFNAALDRAFPDGPPGGCGGYISWDLRPAENPTHCGAGTTRWHSAKDAANAAKRLPGVHGCRARFEPDLRPDPADPWPVSTHTVIRIEAFPCAWSTRDGDSAEVAEVEASLASLPGVTEHGRVCDIAELERQGSNGVGRRPYAWAVLRQDEGSYCDHLRERWSRGEW